MARRWLISLPSCVRVEAESFKEVGGTGRRGQRGAGRAPALLSVPWFRAVKREPHPSHPLGERATGKRRSGGNESQQVRGCSRWTLKLQRHRRRGRTPWVPAVTGENGSEA